MEKSVIEILKRTNIVENDEIEIQNLKNIVVNWPTVEIRDSFDDEEIEEEEVDLENWEIISISDEKLTMCAGGDWQEPTIFSLVPYDENYLMATNIRDGYEDGMHYDDVLKILTN
jgi:hypothetical protein